MEELELAQFKIQKMLGLKNQIFLSIILLLFTGCNKIDSDKWVVVSTGLLDGVHSLEPKCSDDCKKDLLYTSSALGSNVVFEERHYLKGQMFSPERNKTISIEIPQDIYPTSFEFHDEEIYNNLNCAVYHGPEGCGWHRIHKGVVSGVKTSGVWVIYFNVQYGENNSEFKMISNADY